jgi:hypothetical protein
VGRPLEVAPERLDRWLDGFAERHGGVVERTGSATSPRVVSWDGATATCDGFAYDPIGLVLVRRGGYAVGLGLDGRLAAHKVGNRYVQSRTAAGGWSQQRFARRRGNQADELVRTVAPHARRLLPAGIPAGLVLGGDRRLAEQTLHDPALRHLADLPRRELFDLPDPKLDVLREALRRGRAVRITLTEPA